MSLRREDVLDRLTLMCEVIVDFLASRPEEVFTKEEIFAILAERGLAACAGSPWGRRETALDHILDNLTVRRRVSCYRCEGGPYYGIYR